MSTENKIGLVMYTDGSCMPNPGYGGWGIHGYKYTVGDEIKIPATQKKNIHTNCGYRNADELGNVISSTNITVTPVKKLDNLIAYGTPSVKELTNNVKMEIMAIDRGLNWANDIHETTPVSEVYILSDGKVALDAINIHYNKWVKNNWIKPDGTEVKIRKELESVNDILTKLKQKMTVRFEYVKGHNGNFGNTESDKLAKKGSTLSNLGKISDIRTIGVPNNKRPAKYNDFFTKNRWYFMGGEKHADNPPKIGNWYAYYTGSLGKGKKDEDFGVHVADGYSAIVLLKEQEPVLQHVESIYRKQCTHKYDFVVYGNLTTVLTPECYHDIIDNGNQLVLKQEDGKTLILPNEKVVCAEYNPAHLSYIQMDRYRLLQDMIEAYHNEDKSIVITDITDILMEKEEGKKGQVKHKLKDSVGHRNYIRLDITYGDEKKTHPINLTIKTDLPDKQHLAKLIKNFGETIKIRVLSKMISPDAFRYCIAVETEDAKGYWMNFDTALVYL